MVDATSQGPGVPAIKEESGLVAVHTEDALLKHRPTGSALTTQQPVLIQSSTADTKASEVYKKCACGSSQQPVLIQPSTADTEVYKKCAYGSLLLVFFCVLGIFVLLYSLHTKSLDLQKCDSDRSLELQKYDSDRILKCESEHVPTASCPVQPNLSKDLDNCRKDKENCERMFLKDQNTSNDKVNDLSKNLKLCREDNKKWHKLFLNERNISNDMVNKVIEDANSYADVKSELEVCLERLQNKESELKWTFWFLLWVCLIFLFYYCCCRRCNGQVATTVTGRAVAIADN